MRVIFFGTSAFAVPSLERVAASAHRIALVVTQPDRVQGRGLKAMPSPVKEAALRLNLPLAQPEKLLPADFTPLNADVGVVAAYGKILKPDLLAVPPHGMLGVHPSLLPKYRGAAPVNWPILDGDVITGTTIFRLDPGLDSGDILLQEQHTILPEEDADALGKRLAAASADLLVKALDALAAGTAARRPQDHAQATYAAKLTKEQGKISWAEPAVRLERLVRGTAPWPGAQTVWHGEPLKVWRVRRGTGAAAGEPGTVMRVEDGVVAVATGEGVLELVEVQPAGRRRMQAKEFLAGHKIVPGDRLG